MRTKFRAFARDAALVAVAAVVVAFLSLDHGVTALSVGDLKLFIDAAVGAVVVMTGMVVSPWAKKYGVRSSK